ncbi:MAG TPA: FtsQ-type POTRA domain-containing protein [Rhizomicrobium sp.]|nr:FtsQ-type POTRA domain-containing protein [Rhizomicrobium sp.]
MRSVNTRKSTRGKASKPGRRSAPSVSRGTGERRVRRGDDSDNVIVSFLRRLRDALSFRRPMIWMTASFLALTVIAGLLAGGYVQRSFAAVGRSIDSAEVAAGFGIDTIQVTGEHRTAAADIRNALGFKPGQSLFAIDVEQARENLRQLPWVQDAVIHKHFPSTVSVSVVEKIPFALWLSDDQKLSVIDRSGAVIAATDGAEFRNLPHFVGNPPEGAAELVDAIATHRAIAARIRGMQRISERRWNLLLDGGVMVDLPEEGWRKELDDLEHLIVDKGVLERDIKEIDLREPGNYNFILRNGGGTERVAKGTSA